MSTTPIQRRCARVLLVDEDDRLLLFYSNGFMAPGVEYYVIVGGGVEEGESLAEAAAREVFEETGLRLDPADLGPVVAHTEGAWTTHDGVRFYSDDHFFFLRTDRFDVSLDGLEDGEQREISHHLWLSPAELASIAANVLPTGLVGVIERLVGGERPAEPIEMPWVDASASAADA